MSVYEKILGQDKLIEHFRKSVSLGKISNAYIISGEKYSGKKMLANAYAASIECENPVNGEACMECHSCKMSLSGNNPDIRWIVRESKDNKDGTKKKAKEIPVDAIRDQINNDIVVKPYHCKKKVYIIDEAETLNVAAQNALLKTMEEPPEYGVVILLTSNENALLQTILSRSIRLEVASIDDETIKDYLMKHNMIPDYAADVLVSFARGNLGRAIELSQSPTFNEMKDHLVKTMSFLHEKDMAEIGNITKQTSEFKDDINYYFELLTMWFRDILVAKSGGDESKIIFRDEVENIRELSRGYSYRSIEMILKTIEDTKTQIALNVSFDTAFKILYMTIRDGYIR
ncbi:MAG TPA: DNA polymerase III subunit delta [Eubacterium sp.]|nr:DNA polymerase III subunit delta [Eubacterium sp.]